MKATFSRISGVYGVVSEATRSGDGFTRDFGRGVMKISPAPFRGLLFSRAEQLKPGEAKGIGGENSGQPTQRRERKMQAFKR
jgi:hypothetical protein